MKKLAVQKVTVLPVDYALKTVRDTNVLGLTVYHAVCGKGVVVAKGRDCWTIAFEKKEFSGDYSPSVCYKAHMLRSPNPGFESYMEDYISFYS